MLAWVQRRMRKHVSKQLVSWVLQALCGVQYAYMGIAECVQIRRAVLLIRQADSSLSMMTM